MPKTVEMSYGLFGHVIRVLQVFTESRLNCLFMTYVDGVLVNQTLLVKVDRPDRIADMSACAVMTGVTYITKM